MGSPTWLSDTIGGTAFIPVLTPACEFPSAITIRVGKTLPFLTYPGARNTPKVLQARDWKETFFSLNPLFFVFETQNYAYGGCRLYALVV